MSKTRKSALLVIDVQNVYTKRGFDLYCADSRRTTDRINRLIQCFQATRQTVVYVRHVHKADGTDLGRMFDYLEDGNTEFNFKNGSEEVQYDGRLLRVDGAAEIVKTRYSAFQGTKLQDYLTKAQIEKLVICGFMTNFCCESTARQAHDCDYFVDFIVDATGTPGTETIREREMRRIVAEKMSAGIARVFTTKEWLSENA